MEKTKKKQYLAALTSWRGSKGFSCPTILVSATDKDDAIDLIIFLTGRYPGEIKEVSY